MLIWILVMVQLFMFCYLRDVLDTDGEYDSVVMERIRCA